MFALENRYFGFSVGALLTACGAVAIVAVGHLVLCVWVRRHAAAQRKRTVPSPSDSPRLAHWIVQGLSGSLTPVALLLWIQSARFASITMLSDIDATPAVIKVIQILEWLAGLGTLIALAWLLLRIGKTLEQILLSISSRTQNGWDDVLAPLTGRAGRLVLPLLAIILGAPALAISPAMKTIVQNAVSMLIIGTIAFLLLQFVDTASRFILRRQPIKSADNRHARAIFTQVTVLRKMLTALIVMITIASMLMVFESVRHFGTAIIASAGLAGVVVGFAAQKSIATVLAGFQIATTQPIRIDDVVIVEGEWGQIEEITLTYVVVRIWDLRRLILPITYFIEKPFQNWTRTSSDILGTVLIHLDYTVSMDALRAEFKSILESSPLWDHKVAVLQVTDAKERSVEVRGLVSARDAGSSWDLRCDVREKLIAFLQRNHPESLPRMRATIQNPVFNVNAEVTH